MQVVLFTRKYWDRETLQSYFPNAWCVLFCLEVSSVCFLNSNFKLNTKSQKTFITFLHTRNMHIMGQGVYWQLKEPISNREFSVEKSTNLTMNRYIQHTPTLPSIGKVEPYLPNCFYQMYSLTRRY